MLALALVLPVAMAMAPPPGTRERQIRAALTYKIARFVTWPESALPAGNAFTFCYVGDEPTSRALAGIEGRTIQNRRAHMRRLETADARSIGGCNLLYLTGGSMLPADARTTTLADGILVIVDGPRDGSDAGMVQLVPSDNRMGLLVDLAMVRAARLRVDATLLQLAEVRQ